MTDSSRAPMEEMARRCRNADRRPAGTRGRRVAMLLAILYLSLCVLPATGGQAPPAATLEVQQVEVLLEQSRLHEAKSAVNDLLADHPSSAEGYNLLGMIQVRQSDLEGAAGSFQKALALNSRSVKAHLNLANLYVVQNRPALAEEQFRKVLQIEPANREAHYNLGVLLMVKGSLLPAISQFQQVRPPDAASRIQLIRAYLKAKQIQPALRTAAALSASAKDNVQVHFSLGLLLASEKQYKPAQLEFEKADALQPGRFEILYNLGQVLLRNGENGKAEAVLIRALKAQPDSSDAMYLLAQAYTNQSRPLDALDVLIPARKLAPRNADILFLMAQISMAQNYYEDAIPLLEEGLQVAPERPDLLAALGECYFIAGKVEKSTDAFQRLIEIEHSPRSYAFLGLAYRNLGRFDDAKQQFQKGLAIDPKNSLCLFNLGFVAERQGDAATAEVLFQKALQFQPDFADALLELANLRIAAHKPAEAEPLLRRFVRVSQDPATGYYKLAMAERSLHETAAAERDLNVFKTLSKSASTGPYPFQHLFDYLDERSKLEPTARAQLDLDELTAHMKQHPDQPEDLYLLAEAYLKAGRIKDAREVIAQLDHISGDFRTTTGLGVLLARYRVYDAAIEHFQTALEANPNADDVRFDLANALFRERRYPQALETAQRVSSEGQKDGAYLALLGDIYAHMGDAVHASEAYRAAMARNPDNDQNYLSFALLQLRANDLAAARQTLAQGQARIPGSGKIFWGMGLVSALEGKNAEASKELEKSIDLLPEWAGGYSTLGVLYFQQGELEKAREVLSRFKNNASNGGLDTQRIEGLLEQTSERRVERTASLSATERAQFLQFALSLADRTL